MTSFRSDGITLSYDDIRPSDGATAAVILVHGFATNRTENWRRLGWYGAFERRGYRTIALDLRGHGMSDKPHDPAAYDRSAMAADVIRLMDHLDLPVADLIGYSLGAHLAASAAATELGRFANLVLGGVGARALAGAAAREPATMTMAQAMRQEDPADISDPILRGFRQFAQLEGEDRQALAACSEGRPESLEGNLGRLALPVLVVAGARDEIAGDPDVLAAAIAGAKAVSLPGCDHFSTIPHALFKAAVFDFLEGWSEDGP
ncbi:MAG: alpha/beta fold hydrolase [Caulobacteraceae bacterium]